jgi:hypothetical protein
MTDDVVMCEAEELAIPTIRCYCSREQRKDHVRDREARRTPIMIHAKSAYDTLDYLSSG